MPEPDQAPPVEARGLPVSRQQLDPISTPTPTPTGGGRGGGAGQHRSLGVARALPALPFLCYRRVPAAKLAERAAAARLTTTAGVIAAHRDTLTSSLKSFRPGRS